MRKLRIGIALLAISMLLAGWIAPAQAQVQSKWSEPYRLSSEVGKSSEGYLVADQYGYVHCFWTETLFENGRTVIKYARFDGTTWTKPNDIYVAGIGIRNVSPFVDQQGILHIAWAEVSWVLPITLMRRPITPFQPRAGQNRSKSMYQRELSTCVSIR